MEFWKIIWTNWQLTHPSANSGLGHSGVGLLTHLPTLVWATVVSVYSPICQLWSGPQWCRLTHPYANSGQDHSGVILLTHLLTLVWTTVVSFYLLICQLWSGSSHWCLLTNPSANSGLGYRGVVFHCVCLPQIYFGDLFARHGRHVGKSHLWWRRLTLREQVDLWCIFYLTINKLILWI